MAPYNTTQFLLEDREKRVTGDSDGDSVNGVTVANSSGWQGSMRLVYKFDGLISSN